MAFNTHAQPPSTDSRLTAEVTRSAKQLGQYMRVILRYQGELSLQAINLQSWREIAAFTIEDEYRDVDKLERDIQVMVLRLYPRTPGTHILPALGLGKAKSNQLTLMSTKPVVEESELKLEWRISKTSAWQREAIAIHVQLTTSDYSSRIRLDAIEQQQFISKLLNTETLRLPDGKYVHQAGWVLYPLETGKLQLELPPVRYQLSGSDRRRFYLPIQSLTIKPLPSYLAPILPIGKIDVSSHIVNLDDGNPEWQIQLVSDGLIPYGVPGMDTQLALLSRQDIAAVQLKTVQHEHYTRHSNQTYYHAPLPDWLMPYGSDISVKLRYFDPDSGKITEQIHTLPRYLRMPGWAWTLSIIFILAIAVFIFPYLRISISASIDRIALVRNIKKAKTAEEIRGAILFSSHCTTLSEWVLQQPRRKQISHRIDQHCFSLHKTGSIDQIKSDLLTLV
jgi:hypothetical protein